MPNIAFILTVEESAAMVEMLGGATIEDYIKSLAAKHIEDKLDDEFKNKTASEKEQLLS